MNDISASHLLKVDKLVWAQSQKMTAHTVLSSTFSMTIRYSASVEKSERAQTYGNVDVLSHTQDLCDES